MSSEEIRAKGIYYTIIDGTFRTKVDETHPQATRREYETRDGAKAVKYERIVDALTGYIEDMGIYETDFGKVINIKLDPNEEGRNPIIQLNLETNYGEDFLKKAPNIDLSSEVRFSPFSLTNENGREIRGITLTQNGQKIQNYFYDPVAKKECNGFPTPEGAVEDYQKEDWKIHFLRVRKFLTYYFNDEVVPKVRRRTPALDAIRQTLDPVQDLEEPPF